MKTAYLDGQRRILAFTREITARKAAETALKTSEAMYRAIFAASMDGLLLIDKNHTIVDGNAALETITRRPAEHAVGRDAMTFVQSEDREHAEQFLKQIAANGYTEAELELYGQDGSKILVETRGVPVMYRQQQHALVVLRDITAARGHQRALVQGENRLRATIDSALDCIVTMDGEGRILDFNPASERCFGYTSDVAASAHFVDLVVAPRYQNTFHAEIAQVLDRALQSNAGRHMEICCRHADGHELPMDLALGLVRANESNIIVAYLHELTDSKAAELAQAELAQQLMQAQKMEAFGQLTGGIAHDFNNILTSVIGYLALAREQTGTAPKTDIRRHLQRSRRAAKRAQDLVQQMMTYSRGSRGEATLVGVKKRVDEVVSMMASTLSASIHFDVEIARDISPVTIDPLHATQALMKLCINARDAMDGRGTLGIEVTEKHWRDARCTSCRKVIESEFVSIAVVGGGEGIEPALLDRILEPFFSTKPQGKGSGMGLATTHGIVHQYGGHIVVDSKKGVGTTFRLLLPAARGVEQVDGDVLTETPTAATKLSGNVLVVDDNAAVGEFMHDLLKSWGLTVKVYQSGIHAAKTFKQNPLAFDLAVLDQTMPDATGLEIAQQLLEENPTLPIVIYTGYSDVLTDAIVAASGCRA